jgi:hypothetical protein
MRRQMLGLAAVGLALSLSAGIALASTLPEDEAQQLPVAELIEQSPPAVPTPGLAARSFVDQDIVQKRAMLTFTMASPITKKMRGILPSLYQGEFFEPSLEERRKCIVERESSGHYDAVSPGRGYFGAYQMSPELGVGATWMMLKEHRELLGPDVAKEVLAQLREKPVHTWPRYWQDAAFSTVHNWEGKGSGAPHWAGGRWRC